MADMLKRNTSIKIIYLGVTFPCQTFGHFFFFFHFLDTDNTISSEGAKFIWTALRINTTLTELYLGDLHHFMKDINSIFFFLFTTYFGHITTLVVRMKNQSK